MNFCLPLSGRLLRCRTISSQDIREEREMLTNANSFARLDVK